MTDPSRRTEEREERRKRLLLLLLLLLLCLVTTGMGDTVGGLAFRIAGPGSTSGSPAPSHRVRPVQPSRPVQIARGLAYAMAGSVSRKLHPGGPASPIEITFDSRNRGSGASGTRVSLLTVSIDSVTGRGPGPHPCTAADFVVRQIPAAAYPFYVPNGTSLLSSLIGPGRVPAIRMLDRRDGVLGDGTGNQDACKGATVHLRLTGSP